MRLPPQGLVAAAGALAEIMRDGQNIAPSLPEFPFEVGEVVHLLKYRAVAVTATPPNAMRRRSTAI